MLVDAAYEVHRTLGPGLLESAYEAALALELTLRGRVVERQVPVQARDKGHDLGSGFRMDLLVDRCVVVELKVVEALSPMHQSQLLTYLRLTGHRVGFLLNFQAPYFRSGVRRLVL